jgi:hypothetical protein
MARGSISSSNIHLTFIVQEGHVTLEKMGHFSVLKKAWVPGHTAAPPPQFRRPWLTEKQHKYVKIIEPEKLALQRPTNAFYPKA